VFDTVATPADLATVMALVGWTDDALVAERVARLPREDWVFGRPNASVVMGAFLHPPAGGGRFNDPVLGAWYAAGDLETAAREVGHHLWREAVATRKATMTRQYSAFEARIDGLFLDIKGERATRAEAYHPDDYGPSQIFGNPVRAAGGSGIIWDSLRHRGGVCVVSYRPGMILDVIETRQLELTVSNETGPGSGT
jgi:hypothetical protein